MDSLTYSYTMYLQERWAGIVVAYPAALIELVGTFLVQFVSFWILSLLFTLLDTIGPLQKYKIQSLSKQPCGRVLWKCFLCTLLNQMVTTTLHFLQLFILLLFTSQRSVYRVEASLPSLTEAVGSLICAILLRETIFYYGHRLLHHRFLYSRFHKQHHQFTTPIALAAQYAHPVEHIMSNIIPIAAPARLCRLHIVVFWAFMTGTITQATVAHSGYETFAFFGWKPGIHDAHHELFNVNYGLLGILDWIHGTRKILVGGFDAWLGVVLLGGSYRGFLRFYFFFLNDHNSSLNDTKKR